MLAIRQTPESGNCDSMSRQSQFSFKALLAAAAVAGVGLCAGGVQIAIALAIVSYVIFVWLSRFYSKSLGSPMLWAFLAIAAGWLGILAMLVASEG